MKLAKKYMAVAGLLLCACSVAIVVTGCAPMYDISPEEVRDDKPTYRQFAAAHTFPYTAPAARQRRIRRDYSRLTLGLTKDEVAKILGEPDYSQLNYTKGPPPCRFMGSRWTYVLAESGPNLASLTMDKHINVSFNTDDKTRWITSSVDGLKEIRNPNWPEPRTSTGGE